MSRVGSAFAKDEVLSQQSKRQEDILSSHFKDNAIKMMSESKKSRTAASQCRSATASHKSYAQKMKEVSIYSRANSNLPSQTRSRRSNSIAPASAHY